MNKYDIKIEKFEEDEIVVGNPIFFNKEEFEEEIKTQDIKIIPGTYKPKYVRIMNTTGVICNEPLQLEHADKHGNIQMHAYKYLPKGKY